MNEFTVRKSRSKKLSPSVAFGEKKGIWDNYLNEWMVKEVTHDVWLTFDLRLLKRISTQKTNAFLGWLFSSAAMSSLEDSRIPVHSSASHWIRIETIVIFLVLQSTPTHVNDVDGYSEVALSSLPIIFKLITLPKTNRMSWIAQSVKRTTIVYWLEWIIDWFELNAWRSGHVGYQIWHV